MKLFSTFIFLLLALFSFSQTITSKSIYIKDNYKVQFPSSWQLDTSRVMGSELFIIAPLENLADNFRENINLMIQNLSGQNITIEKYKEITDKQINDFATDPKIFESSITKTTKNEYFKITYAMTQGKSRLKITSLCFIKNEKAYLITLTTELDKYDQYKNIGEEILSSFNLSK